MKKLLPILALFSSAALSAQAQFAPASSGSASASASQLLITERGPHHRQWSWLQWTTNHAGQVSIRTNLAYVELATGMHRLDPQTGQWTEAGEQIEAVPGGAIARQGQHQVIFANDLATVGAIDMQTPDGKRLTSHVLGLSYFDAATGTNVLIAEVTNCVGRILSPNQVIYENAFDTLAASVRYTYTRGGFEQDILLLEAPAPPDAYGLNPATTRLVVMTEFLNPPQPTIQQSMAKDSAGAPLEDDALDFAAMQVGRGSGFLLGPSATGAGLRIYKQWAELEGRQFLLEQVRAVDLFKAINALPSKQGASLKSARETIRFTASTRQLPSHKPVKADIKAMQLATGRQPQKGYVLDYTAVISTNNFTFQNDTTYYVSGSVNLSGNTTFEGGTVIKFAPTNNACLNLATALCRGSMYHPSIFTARDDNTVGLTIPGSTGNPTTNFYASAMLNLQCDSSPLRCLRLSYATKAIQFSGGSPQTYSLSHAQLVNCQLAFNDLGDDGIAFTLNNVLFCNVASFCNSGLCNAINFYGAHLTMDHVTNGPSPYSVPLGSTNSLFAATSGFSGGVSNAYFSSGSGVFQTVGAASHYLIGGSTNRIAGTTNLDPGLLADLQKRTTYPPVELTNNITTDTTLSLHAQRDTDIPDLGYNYDPLDYVVSGLTLTTNTLVLTNGVALGTYGTQYGVGISSAGTHGGTLVSGGLADRLNYIVHYNAVQEQSTTNWARTSVCPSVYLWSGYGSAQFRFTGWSIPGGSGDHFNNGGYSVMASFQNCQFSGGTFTVYQSSAALTNCLWERVALSFFDDDTRGLWYLQNNLFRGGSLSYDMDNYGSGTTGIAYDNLFDRTSIGNGMGMFTNGYNAYVTNYSRLSSSQGHDVILTNSPVYQTSYLGNYYYPTKDGMLSTLIDRGSRPAIDAGLYSYTTTTNQTIEGGSQVDIGFHYVALDAAGNPLDSDGDGIPDYIPTPARIITGPIDQTINVWDDWEFIFITDDVTFTAVAVGSPPLSYQWTFTDIYNTTTTDIPGATASSLTLPHASLDAAGTYAVTVRNAFGSDSGSATLTANSGTPDALELTTGTRSDFTFKGDTTYWLDQGAVVTLTGTTTIEGGAVIKYGQGASIIIQGDVHCHTAPYSPAIFTAVTDDTMGWYQEENPADPYAQYYAAVALDIQSTKRTQIHDLRISHASIGIRYWGDIPADVTDSVRHVQLVHCGTAFRSLGKTASPPHVRFLDLGNVLISGANTAISGSYFRGKAQHLTVDNCSTLVSDDAANGYGFSFPFTNSIFSTVTSVGQGLDLTASSNNGFYPETATPFGAAPIALTDYPFAPTTIQDGLYDWLTFENGQGYYYLADGSPLVDAGTPNIDPSLQADLARMTTAVPPPLFSDDINSSQTIGPRAVRDTDTPDVGYHYPAVDYVINGATVNNCTLNIDPGTVLALVSGVTIDLNTYQPAGPGWPWGLRLNAGARLNVNGVPTNRVVFARLETIQEHTEGYHIMSWYDTVAPYITFDDIVCYPGGVPTPATPLAEAKFKYADFRTPCSSSSGLGGISRHFGPLRDWPDPNFSMIGNLELSGCLFQGGRLIYDEGGPQNRVLGITNTIFERCVFDIQDTGAYNYRYHLTPQPAQITVVNNLFYQCLVPLSPLQDAGPGASWSFIDNIFDHAIFGWNYGNVENGPVGVNKYNAYIGMSGNPDGGDRLQPNTYAGTDPVLQSLAYQTGPLGRFYLPSTCAALVNKGSRTASAAGEYHFTCLTNNQKEAGAQVSIGAHYLALASGGAADSNGDGIPDFLADRNGDGNEDSDEIPWMSANNGSLAILSPTTGAVSGIIQLRVGLSSGSSTVKEVVPHVDGVVISDCTSVQAPASSCASIEVDTRSLEDGTHDFSVVSYDSTPSASYSGPTMEESGHVMLVTANSLRFPDWHAMAEEAIRVSLKVPPCPTATLCFFDESYPKAYPAPPTPVNYIDVDATSGGIDYAEMLVNLGISDSTTEIYSFTEYSSGGQAFTAPNRNTTKGPKWPTGAVGKWVVAYQDDGAEFYLDTKSRPFKPTRIADNGQPWGTELPWLHFGQLDGWRSCAQWANSGSPYVHDAPGLPGEILPGFPGALVPPDPTTYKQPTYTGGVQTWPIRTFWFGFFNYNMNFLPDFKRDIEQLSKDLQQEDARNFYGHGHGGNTPEDVRTFITINPNLLQAKAHRYRFAFLDGCETALNQNLLYAFGADSDEFGSGTKLRDLNQFGGGPLQLALYPSTGPNKRRPGLFAGYRTLSLVAIWYNQITHERDPVTGCELHTYDALCNWHSALVGYWNVSNYDFVRAAKQASLDTMCSSPIWPFPQPDPDHTLVPVPEFPGKIPFTPDDCLVVFGYGGLKLRDYNAEGDTW